jgi:hypothetical protein
MSTIPQRTRNAIYALSPEYEDSSRRLRAAKGRVLVADIPVESAEGWRMVPIFLDGSRAGGAKFIAGGRFAPLIIVFAGDFVENRVGKLVPVAPVWTAFVDKVVHEAVHASDEFKKEILTPPGLRLWTTPLRRTRRLLETARSKLERDPLKPSSIEDRYEILVNEVVGDEGVRAELHKEGAFRGGDRDALRVLAEQTYRHYWKKRRAAGAMADPDTVSGRRTAKKAFGDWGSLYVNTDKEFRAHTAQLIEQIFHLEQARSERDVAAILDGRADVRDCLFFLIGSTKVWQEKFADHLDKRRMNELLQAVWTAFHARYLDRPRRGLRKA